MKCSEIQFDLPLYADGRLAKDEASCVAEHLDTCPVCRAANAEFMEMRSAMRAIGRPDVPVYLYARIRSAAPAERRAIRSRWMPFPADVREWLMHAVMPYSVGTVASVVLGLGLLLVLGSSVGRYPQFAGGGVGPGESGVMLAADRDPWA